MDNEIISEHVDSCYHNNIKPIMEEIKSLGKQLNAFEKRMIECVTRMPKDVLDEADKKYAKKDTEETVAAIVTAVGAMKEKRENRAWEALGVLFNLLIALGVAYLAVTR